MIQRLGLMMKDNSYSLFDCETGEIFSEDLEEIVNYLSRKDGSYTLQIF